MEAELRPLDAVIADLADRQHGVVARRQLTAIGLGEKAISHRMAVGRLHALHRGVYSVGRRSPSPRGRWLAAVLACGPGALLSHRDAAALWDLLPPAAGSVDITSGGRSRAGIRIHRTRNLSREDRAICESIPCTSVARTIADLAGVLDRQRLVRLIGRAEELQLFDLKALRRVRDRGGGRSGMRLLGMVLADYREPPVTRSHLERQFFDLWDDVDLPLPVTNATVAGLEVDALWPEQRLVVELDGYKYHRSRVAFERDRERDGRLLLAGYRVLRFTARRIAREPEEVTADVRRLLRTTWPS